MSYAATRSIDGTVSVITGATAGIGAATARSLVAAGGKVALAGRRQERLDALVAELREDNAVAVSGDVADPAHRSNVVGTRHDHARGAVIGRACHHRREGLGDEL